MINQKMCEYAGIEAIGCETYGKKENCDVCVDFHYEKYCSVYKKEYPDLLQPENFHLLMRVVEKIEGETELILEVTKEFDFRYSCLYNPNAKEMHMSKRYNNYQEAIYGTVKLFFEAQDERHSD